MTKSYIKKVAVRYANPGKHIDQKLFQKSSSELCEWGQAVVTAKKVAVNYANQGKAPPKK